jgi:hypothetical protein
MTAFKLTHLIGMAVLLTACDQQTPTQPDSQAFGPQQCAKNVNSSLIKRFKSSSLHKLESCFDVPMSEVVERDWVLLKAQWISRYQGRNQAKQYLLEVINQGFKQPEVHHRLAEIYFLEQDYLAAQDHATLAGLPPDHLLPVTIDYHLNGIHPFTHTDSLPALYTTPKPYMASIRQGNVGFQLTRVSDGNPAVINGEPSMTTSADGQHMWLLWTDSGVSEAADPDYYYWRIKSARSSDGGLTWNETTINPLPQTINRFHFDPMTTFSLQDDQIVAGGMIIGFDTMTDNASYVYRWNLGTDQINGPHFTPFVNTNPDKGWLATNQAGHVFHAHNQGIDLSTDQGVSFSRLFNDFAYAPHPRMDHADCLIVTDHDGLSRSCNNNDYQQHPHNFSSLLKVQSYDLVPGTFRVPFFVINATVGNDIYAVFTDRKAQGSNDLTIYMTRSSDNGQTWDQPWVVAPDISGDQFIPWLEADPYGGLHLIYFDTRNLAQSDTNDEAVLDLYYSYSSDSGVSWEETRVTPTSFTTPELIWGDYFFTDYLSMNITPDSVNIAFPWSTHAGQMHMYFASKSLSDVIFADGFQ